MRSTLRSEAGDAASARRHADALERYASVEPTPWSDFTVARGRALADVIDGHGDVAAVRALRARAVAPEPARCAARARRRPHRKVVESRVQTRLFPRAAPNQAMRRKVESDPTSPPGVEVVHRPMALADVEPVGGWRIAFVSSPRTRAAVGTSGDCGSARASAAESVQAGAVRVLGVDARCGELDHASPSCRRSSASPPADGPPSGTPNARLRAPSSRAAARRTGPFPSRCPAPASPAARRPRAGWA